MMGKLLDIDRKMTERWSENDRTRKSPDNDGTITRKQPENDWKITEK